MARHAAQLGWQVALAPLGADAGGGAGGAAPASGVETDDELLAAQLRAQLTAALQGPAVPQTASAMACLEVHQCGCTGCQFVGGSRTRCAADGLAMALPKGACRNPECCC